MVHCCGKVGKKTTTLIQITNTSYAEEEVQAIIDGKRQETEKQIFEHYSEEEIQKLIANCQLELARRQETAKKNQEEGKDKDNKSARKTLKCE